MKRSAAPDAVLKEIEAGSFRPLYLLFGDDTLSAEEIVAALKAKVVAPGLEAFDMEVIHATDIGEAKVSVEQVLQHVRQIPFGSPRRLVVIRDLAVLDRRPGRSLCAGLALVPESCCVAVTCDYDETWAKIFRESGVENWVVVCRPPERAELREMVRRWAGRHRLALDAEVIDVLLDIVGSEAVLLKGEVEKMATLLEPGVTVTVGDVRRLASSTRGYELGEYTRSIRQRNTSNALDLLHRLDVAGEEPVRIIYWLAGMLLSWVYEAKKGVPALELALDRLYEINKAVLNGHPEPFALLDIFTVCLGCFGRGKCTLTRLEPRPEFCLAPPRLAVPALVEQS